MKNLFLLFFVFFISFSFGQTKKKGTLIDSSIVKEDNIHPIGVIDDDINIIYARSTSTVGDNTIYKTEGVEVKPEFIGGWGEWQEFIKKNFVTPEVDGQRIKGKVYVSFVIEKDGSISDIKILRDIGYNSGKEAIKVLKKMPKWKPGQRNGENVRCFFPMPISVPQ